jgi:type I restriction enzyme S subunit
VTYVKEAYWPHNTALYVKDFKGNDPLFVSYLLRTLPLAELNSGAAQPSLNRNFLYPVPVNVPDFKTQRRIASILGAYADLIEVNRRRVKLLEEMARGLFEEWFVRFRFPGHETIPLLDTPNGKLPEGWKEATLGDFLTLQRGFDLPATQRLEGTKPVISASGFHGMHSEAKVAGPGIVTGRSGTIGQVHLIMEEFWPLNTTLYVKEFKKAGPAFAKLLLDNLNLLKHAAGAAVPTLNRNHIHCLARPMPPDDLLDRFERIAMANMCAVDNLQRQSEKLAASRDLLLPRLISGQLSVAAAEQQLAAE